MVTSYDVARLAGVSQPTVSRTFRDSPLIKPETKERVRAAARTLVYTPNQQGRVLATRRTNRIGVVAAELGNPFYMALLEPLHEALRQYGFSTALIPGGALDTPLEPGALVDGSLDGVILTTCRIGSTLPAELTLRGLPTVTANREVRGAVVDSCAVANARGAAELARLLTNCGHREIVAIFGPSDTSTGLSRERGFRRGLAAAGVRLSPVRIWRGEFTYQTGYDSAIAALGASIPPTALFCANDVIALGALNAALAAGVDVPGDLSVVGFDDIPMAGWNMFDLTTMHCDLGRLARTSADLLAARIRAPEAPRRRVVIHPTLVLRSSHRDRLATRNTRIPR